MTSTSARTREEFGFVPDALILLFNNLFVSHPKFINPFDVRPSSPTCQQCRGLCSPILVCEDNSVADDLVTICLWQDFVVHQQRNVREVVNRIGARKQNWRPHQSQTIFFGYTRSSGGG